MSVLTAVVRYASHRFNLQKIEADLKDLTGIESAIPEPFQQSKNRLRLSMSTHNGNMNRYLFQRQKNQYYYRYS